MRLNDAARTETSSSPSSGNAAMLKSPTLTLSVAADMLAIGRMMIQDNIRFSATNTATNTAANESMNVTNVRLAFSTGTLIGADTTCAPMISLCFQPKPLFEP